MLDGNKTPEPHQSKAVKPPRHLTRSEFAILEVLLNNCFQGSHELREQLKHVRVSGECTGCLSIDFTIDHNISPYAHVIRRIPIEGETDDTDNVTIHFLLHVVNGFMSVLEIFREDNGKVSRIPDSTLLHIVSY